MSDDWNDYAEHWDTDSNARIYADLAFGSLLAQLDLNACDWKDKRILDFGCGTGLLAEKTAAYVNELVATDTADKMIAVLKAKNIPNVRALCCDMLDTASPQEPALQKGFDLIYASSVCSFLPDYQAAVRCLVQRLNPGGYFVQWDWQGAGSGDFGLSLQQIETCLSAAGLSALQVKPAFDIRSDANTLPVLLGIGRL